MVGGLEQRKWLLDPEKWRQPQSKPDWGTLHEREHSRHVVFVDVPEHEWLRQDFEQAELQWLVWKLLRARRAKKILRVLWEHREQERAMARLEDAANAEDERAFLDTLKSVTWQNQSPADFMHAVRLALEAGAHLAARQLATEGAERYPGDPQLRKYAGLLAPPKVVPSKVRSDRRQRKANREWFRAHGNECRGQWVAVRDGELLGASGSLEELAKRVGDTEGVLLARAY